MSAGADFAALWLLAHETRFGRADQPVAECSLEAWRNAGRKSASETEFYVPYKGQESAADFKLLYKSGKILFQKAVAKEYLYHTRFIIK